MWVGGTSKQVYGRNEKVSLMHNLSGSSVPLLRNSALWLVDMTLDSLPYDQKLETRDI